MSNLLDRKLPLRNRIVGIKKHACEQAALSVLPSATEPKELFAATHRQCSRDNLTVNLSRAVIQNAWQPLIRGWRGEFRPSHEDVGFVVVLAGRRDNADDVHRITQAFLDNAGRLDQRGRTDAALDIIFDQIDEMLLANEFKRVDQLLAETLPSEFSVELLLGILTATLPAKNRLPSRPVFYERVRQALRDRGESEDGLLVGLD